jgi:hypothetical protein
MPTESAPALPKPEWNARGVRGTVVPSRRGLPGLVVCAFLLLTGLVGCAMAQPPRTGPSLGMNLSGPADWNTELPFVDVFRMSREWISQKEGAGWGQGPKLDLDEQGWVKRLEPGCWAETLLCTIDGGHYPSGDYTVLWDGEGRIELGGAASIARSSPHRLVARVDSSRGSIFLRLKETSPQDPVRNIRFIMPGFEKTYATEPFRPEFLKRWQGVACLRFMDWMATNGSRIVRWSERPKLTDATWSRAGIPVEVMVDLANRLKADAWFCMPHRADDDYVRRFAALVKQKLDPAHAVYVEYSNEVWNSGFEQSRWAGEEGKRLGLADKPWEAAWRYTARRSVAIFRIWEEAFGRGSRLVRVVASQAANPYVSEQVVGFEDAYKHADALAIAPYVTCNVAPNGKPSVAEVERWTVDQALDYMEQTALPESIRWIQGQAEVAKKHGLKLIAYEGGQHMVGVLGGENSAAVEKVLHAANAHPRMGDLYRQYFDAWQRAGGGLFCYFASTASWSKWGSWGILQYADDDPAKSPKFMAAMGWARRCGQQVNIP